MSAKAQQTFEGLMVPPEALLDDNNVRFGLKKFRVDSMCADIIDKGGITQPLDVVELAEPGPNGEQYLVTDGHYRLAGARKANKEGAGLLIPIIVRDPVEAADRLKRQLSANLEREDMSPMDSAVAIQKMLDQGMQKVDIRKVFSRPGGRKGLSMQPMSNALLNIYLTFLEFPKDIQNKIHDGRLGVAAAYALAKYAQDHGIAKDDPKITQILEKAEADRLSAIEKDEKDEEKFLEAERKAAEAEEKAKQEAKAIEEAEKLAAKAEETAKAKIEVSSELFTKLNATPVKDKDARKAADEAFKAAEAEKKTAEKAAAEARAQAEKLREKAEKAKTAAEERRKKLEEARLEAAKKAAPGPGNVARAAAAVDNGVVKLNGPQMRKMIEDLCLPGVFPKVQRIGQALRKCIDSEITDTQLMSELGYITGERKEKPKHLKG